MIHQPITADPTLLDSIKRSLRSLTIAEQVQLATYIADELPQQQQIDVVRGINEAAFTHSYASDRIEHALANLEDDLRIEAEVAANGIGVLAPINAWVRQPTSPEARL